MNSESIRSQDRFQLGMIMRTCHRRSCVNLLYTKQGTLITRLYKDCRAASLSTCPSSKMESDGRDYSTWSPEQLIDRVTKLEQQLREANERL